jgi:hypothetical protein
MREGQGRTPSKATLALAETLASELTALCRVPEQSAEKQAEVDRLYLEFLEITARGRR